MREKNTLRLEYQITVRVVRTYVQFQLDTPILHRAAERLVDGEIELEAPCVNTSGELGLRCRVSSPYIKEFERGLEIDETVSDYRVLDQRTPDETLYQIQLSETGRENCIVPLLGEYGGELVEAKRSGDRWSVRLQFPDHASLQGFIDDYRSRPRISIHVEKLGRENSADGNDHGLTKAQYETLRVACEQGYFEVPRRTSLVSLSDELGVSDNAVSERLRRAQSTLCERLFNDVQPPQ